MPYIDKERRLALWNDSPIDFNDKIETAGELNFRFTEIINDYLLHKGLNYQHINDIIGALEGAKAEFQRRVVNKYEDKKIKENKDVYHKSLI